MQEHVNPEFHRRSYGELDPEKAFLTWCVTTVQEWENSKGRMDPKLFVELMYNHISQYEKCCDLKEAALELKWEEEH